VSRYRFYIETEDGQTIEWRGLTDRMAKAMYTQTDNHTPSNVKAYGWEVIE
jgi:hypothetical protein